MDKFEVCIMMYMLYVCYLMVLNINKRRRWWVREVNLRRDFDGYFELCFKRIKESDPEDFFKHTRMTRPVYELLLSLKKDELTKISIRTPISAECRLALTLTYLSQGVSHQFLAWTFKMGKSTVREIVIETCDVFWRCLSPVYVCRPKEHDFKEIAADFKRIWDLPNCVGAIDGKHINIQRPPKSGSNFFNYKHNFSIVLLASCDARYCFTAVDVGAYGSQSDGGVLSYSEFGKLLVSGQLGLPEDSCLPHTNCKFPYFFVGDPAFPLKKYLMRPYPGKLLSREKRIFNYRISRARVTIENAFGILVSRWRILQNKLNCNPENAEKIVLATVALHNFIKCNDSATQYCPTNYVDWEDDEGNIHPGEWRNDSSVLHSARMGSNNAARSAFELRDKLKQYFINEGAIQRQNKI